MGRRLLDRARAARLDDRLRPRQAARGRLPAGRQEIGLSAPLTAVHPDEEVRDTILHEIAHALVGPRHGHDEVWRAMALRIGCSGERCVSDDAPGIEGDWVGTCPAGHRVTRHRRPERPSSCRDLLARFDVAHLLSWTFRGHPRRCCRATQARAGAAHRGGGHAGAPAVRAAADRGTGAHRDPRQQVRRGHRHAGQARPDPLPPAVGRSVMTVPFAMVQRAWTRAGPPRATGRRRRPRRRQRPTSAGELPTVSGWCSASHSACGPGTTCVRARTTGTKTATMWRRVPVMASSSEAVGVAGLRRAARRLRARR